MNETEVLQSIGADRQLGTAGVVYLEGTSDVPIFFALLGLPKPADAVHRGVLVRGLSGKTGSGRTAARDRVELAVRGRISGVYGVTDGDGESLVALSASFAPPFAGPCFRWPAYCIENLLVRTGWPAGWGVAPDWTSVLLEHAPYVALNRVHLELLQSLRTLGLTSFTRPTLQEPMRTSEEVRAALAQDKHLLAGYDVEARFRSEVADVEAIVSRSVDEGHALVNGKWLVDVFAPRTLGTTITTPPRCRDEWIAHAVSTGGLPEVRALWERITGRPP